jgi:hypothetical protein
MIDWYLCLLGDKQENRLQLGQQVLRVKDQLLVVGPGRESEWRTNRLHRHQLVLGHLWVGLWFY